MPECVHLLLVLVILVVVDDLELHRDDGVFKDREEEDGVVQEVEADEGVEGYLRRESVGSTCDSPVSWSLGGRTCTYGRRPTYHVLRVHREGIVRLLFALL